MKITADTNLLARVLLGDEPGQARLAEAILGSVASVAVPAPVLCELAWLLTRRHRLSGRELEEEIRTIARVETVVTDRPALDAGLEFLRAGGDFADGVIARQGRDLGGRVFASFDHRAVAILRAMGQEAAHPGELIGRG